MLIVCPHCQAKYQLDAEIHQAIFVCHRCQTEFGVGISQAEEDASLTHPEISPEMPLFDYQEPIADSDQQPETACEDVAGEQENPAVTSAFVSNEPLAAATSPEANETSEHIATAVDESEADARTVELAEGNTPAADKIVPQAFAANNETEIEEDEAAKAPPTRRQIRLWPWISGILIMLASAGFWMNQDAWLSQPGMRSLLIGMHLDTAKNSDWKILPKSIEADWLQREDGSQILLIRGRIKNRLYIDQMPPAIRLRFKDANGAQSDERVLNMTEPPSLFQLEKVPYLAPKKDVFSIAANGQRSFVLVLESWPEFAEDFTLTPEVSNRP